MYLRLSLYLMSPVFIVLVYSFRSLFLFGIIILNDFCCITYAIFFFKNVLTIIGYLLFL